MAAPERKRHSALADDELAWTYRAKVSEQTRGHYRAAVARYREWAGDGASIAACDRTGAAAFVTHLLSDGAAQSTVRRHASALSQLWEKLAAGRGGDNPWLGLDYGGPARRRAGRRPLTTQQLLTLLTRRSGAWRFAGVLPDVIRLALLTGAQIEEICSLTCRDVLKREDGYWLRIGSSRRRLIPLHELAAPIIERRVNDGGPRLFANLIPGGPDQRLSWYVSKAYGRFRRAVGVKDAGADFEALGLSFMHALHEREVPAPVVEALTGRVAARPGQRLSNAGQADLRRGIEMLDYGPKVMRALRAP